MKREGKEAKNIKNRKILLTVGAVIIILIVSLVLFLLVFTRKKTETNGITDQILSYAGFSRSITREEYDFFESLAMKEVRDRGDEKQVAEKTEELLRLSDAQFYLGNKLGLCEPFSFESMCVKMTEENANRKVKKENDEVIYGPVEYTIDGFYNYTSSRLRTDIIEYIVKNADQDLTEKAKEYYSKQEEDFIILDKVVYSLTADGMTSENTISGDEMDDLRDKDYQLAQILTDTEEGKDFSYIRGDTEVTGKIITVTETKKDFEENKSSIIAAYLEKKYFDELLLAVAEKNPVNMVIN